MIFWLWIIVFEQENVKKAQLYNFSRSKRVTGKVKKMKPRKKLYLSSQI